jgi:transcriptional regulator with XRE-family HTH domain
MLGMIIKELRNEMNCTQSQLADVLGVTQDSISLWENDNRVPDTQYIVAMAKFFDVTTDYLLGLTDEYENIRFSQGIKNFDFTSDEIALLKSYRAMSEKEKALLTQYIQLLKLK